GTDIDKAQVLVQNRVSSSEPRLPEEVRRSGVTVRKNSPDLLLVVHLVSPDNTYDGVYTSNYALLNVRDELARIKGVGAVSFFGAREYSMRVWLDPERIASLSLTADEVMAALRAQNVQVAGGAIGQPPVQDLGAFQVQMQLKGRLTDPRDFGKIVIKSGAGGRVVKLEDVARTELGALNYSTYGYQDAVPATVMIITQQPGSNAIETTNAVKAEMARLSLAFPKGLEYRIIYNPTEFIEVSISELYLTILEAVALVVVVILVFLQAWRAAVIPLVAIPVSLIGTFAVMQGFGFSINMLTLFGLVLAVGIVVDDAIVVVENVERKLAEGLAPIEAARSTMDEVGTALIAIALVLSAVFIPTAFVGGITGQFYRQFAITVATATVISAFVSLTLSPALASLLLKPHEDAHGPGNILMRPVRAFLRGFNRGFDTMARGYGRLVRRLIASSGLVLAVYAGLIAAAAWLVAVTPAGFIPKMDRGVLIISAQLPAGASLQRTDDIVRRIDQVLLATPGIIHTSSYAGRSGATFTNATNAGALFAILDEAGKRQRAGLTAEKIAQDLRVKFSTLQEASVFVFIPPPVRGVGGSTGFAMRLQDRGNLGPIELERVAREFIAAANRTPGITNVFTTFATQTPQLYLDVDRDKAQMLKVPLTAIFEALRIYMGSAYVNDFNMFGRTYRVTAQADSAFRVDPANVSRIRVRSTEG
ncbi:MAG: efflux RND transporter permease subunit, partial [Hyphomicrobium sp.]